MHLALVRRLLPQKAMRETVTSQARASPALMEFLTEYLLEEYLSNLSAVEDNGYGGDQIGRAREAHKILELLKGLEHG